MQRLIRIFLPWLTKKPAKNYQRRNAVQMQREERRQELMEIAQQENIPISHCNDVIQSPTSTLDTTNLEEELLQITGIT